MFVVLSDVSKEPSENSILEVLQDFLKSSSINFKTIPTPTSLLSSAIGITSHMLKSNHKDMAILSFLR